VFADDRNAAAVVADVLERRPHVADVIGAHCRRIVDGDYFAILAYVEMSDVHVTVLQELRHLVRDATGRATCLQFGPRFLHSTGQAYKGGPNSGVFLQITCDDPEDIEVPGRRYTFGVVKAAQARGDLAVLWDRGRRVIRVHIHGDVDAGLARLTTIVRQAMGDVPES
jgi:transaldolase/glucose-6-phosphate isomerase